MLSTIAPSAKSRNQPSPLFHPPAKYQRRPSNFSPRPKQSAYAERAAARTMQLLTYK